MQIDKYKQPARTGVFYKFYHSQIVRRLSKYNKQACNPTKRRAFYYESKMISTVVDSKLCDSDKKELLCTIVSAHGKDKLIYWLSRTQDDFSFKKMMHLTYGKVPLTSQEFVLVFFTYINTIK